MYNMAKNEMNKYYRMTDLVGKEFRDEEIGRRIKEKAKCISDEMDLFYKENPAISKHLLKSKIHSLMAKYCEPVIFFENPFFFETEFKHSLSRGLRNSTPADWLNLTKNEQLKKEYPSYAKTTERYKKYFDGKTNNLCSLGSSFDTDHHTMGYTKLFKTGVGGLIKEAKISRENFKIGTDEYNFCSAVIESLDSLIIIAHKFSEKAEDLLKNCTEERYKANLKKIAQTARKIPEFPPETFYEGLAMIIFMREITATLEAMGISQFGHVDRLLGNLYKQDLETGRITEEEARELVAIWMMHTDIKFDIENNSWPESSICIELGGCDEDGNTVFNEVTRIFIEEHLKHNLISPKLNCRFAESSTDEYLKLIGKAIISGHNNFALFNDEEIISGLIKNGVREKDARMYVNGGCLENMLEGFGHTEGTAFYMSIIRLLDIFLRPDRDAEIVKSIDKADSFEEFYRGFLLTIKDFYNEIIDQRNYRQSYYKNALSFPIYSATQDGCIKSGKDYVDGGAKYNFSTVTVVGLANTVDSLVAVKNLVYDQKRFNLKEFVNILEKNWEGNEVLRSEVLDFPKFGHNDKNVDELANRLICDIAKIVNARENERGGMHLLSTFTYNHGRTLAPHLRATPDGRRDGEFFAANCSPSTLKEVKDVTKPIKSMQNIDFSVCGGISILELMLPASRNFDEDRFLYFIKACGKCGCVAVQPNIVSVDTLIDAQKKPEEYKNLTVRICGLSARFTALSTEVQNEIINRNFYE